MDVERAENLAVQACMGYVNRLMSYLECHNNYISNMREKFIKNLTKKLRRNVVEHQESVRATIDAVINKFPKKKKKRIWMFKRSREWWNSISNSDNYDEILETFRMDRETFKYLCQKLEPELKAKMTNFRTLSVEIKVAISIYKLGSCDDYSIVANKFGVQKSTVQKCIYQFCNAMKKVFLEDQIKMPVGEEAQTIINEFEEIFGIPQVWGAIGGTHIPISPKSRGYKNYINSEGWGSILLQGVVDSNYLFRDITCKHPGCTPEVIALEDLNLYKNSDQLEFPTKLVFNKSIPAFIVGDPAYPLLSWLMKGYVEVTSAEEDSFNVYLNQTSIVVENAFGRLKGRWRILQKRIDVDVDFLSSLVMTCCILHNILERRKTAYNPSWDEEALRSAAVYVQPTSIETLTTIEGEEFRNHLKDYMSINYPLLTTSNM